MSTKTEKVQWRVNLPRLFEQIVEDNDNMWIMAQPLTITNGILAGLARYCSKQDDPVLHSYMVRLGLYEISNPESPEFNQELMNEIIQKGKEAMS